MENNQEPIEVKATLVDQPYTSVKNTVQQPPKVKQLNALSQAVEDSLTFSIYPKRILADVLFWVSCSSTLGAITKLIILGQINIHWIILLVVVFCLIGIGIFLNWAWSDISVKAKSFLVIRCLLVVLGMILGGN